LKYFSKVFYTTLPERQQSVGHSKLVIPKTCLLHASFCNGNQD